MIKDGAWLSRKFVQSSLHRVELTSRNLSFCMVIGHPDWPHFTSGTQVLRSGARIDFEINNNSRGKYSVPVNADIPRETSTVLALRIKSHLLARPTTKTNFIFNRRPILS